MPACQLKQRGVREGPTRALSPAREGEGEGERLGLGLGLGLGSWPCGAAWLGCGYG